MGKQRARNTQGKAQRNEANCGNKRTKWVPTLEEEVKENPNVGRYETDTLILFLDRYTEIERENRILLEKMTNIM